MTRAPDPADSSDLGVPQNPADYSPRRRGLGVAFWAMIAFGVLCVLAGVAVSRFGPVLFPLKAAPAAAIPPAAVGAEPAPTAAADQAAVAPIPPKTPPPSPAQLQALAGRVDRLDSGQRRIALAAGQALAAADLSQASQGSRPFADALSADDHLLPDSPNVRALRALAQTGAPSRAALAAELAGLADRVAVASRAPAQGAGLLAHVVHALSAVFTLRRVDRTSGTAPDAVLARAQQHANDGDLEGALKTLAALPPPDQDALAEWRARAQRRVEIDRRIALLRTAAIRDAADVAGLSDAAGGPRAEP